MQADTESSETPPPVNTASGESDEAPKRAVARKSTASRKPEHQQTVTTKWEYEGTISTVDIKPLSKEPFKSHICGVK